MAKFWSKPTELSPALSASLADLDRLARQRPELEDPARSLGPVMIAAFREPFVAKELKNADVIKVDEPAFRQIGMEVDLADASSRMGAIAQALRSVNPAAPAVASGLLRSHFDTRSKHLTETYLAQGVDLAIGGRLDEMCDVAEAIKLDGELCTSLIRLSLLNQLGAYTAVLAKVRDTSTWNRGDCPNCGGPPLLAETRGLEAKRYLRCGICAADWPFARLRCPACDITDHRKLATRFAEGEGERYKLALCESCSYQIRVVATLEALSIPGLLVAELATSHLEYLEEVPGMSR